MESVIPWLTEGAQAPNIEELHVGRDALMLSVANNRVLALVMPTMRDLHIPGVAFRPLHGGPTSVTIHAVWSRYNSRPALRAFLKTVAIIFGPSGDFPPPAGS